MRLGNGQKKKILALTFVDVRCIAITNISSQETFRSCCIQKERKKTADPFVSARKQQFGLDSRFRAIHNTPAYNRVPDIPALSKTSHAGVQWLKSRS